MKIAGIVCIVLAIAAALFIYSYDLIIKHEPHVTLGPRPGPALGVAILILITGIILVSTTPPDKYG